jgi:hypothetical protein
MRSIKMVHPPSGETTIAALGMSAATGILMSSPGGI